MIAGMDPVLDPVTYVFVSLPDGYRSQMIAAQALALFREDEGVSLVLTEETAADFALKRENPQRRITLGVHSALDSVGLTAAVSGALAEAGIACNCVAAFYHDHLFVPAGDAERALAVLKSVQAGASGPADPASA